MSVPKWRVLVHYDALFLWSVCPWDGCQKRLSIDPLGFGLKSGQCCLTKFQFLTANCTFCSIFGTVLEVHMLSNNRQTINLTQHSGMITRPSLKAGMQSGKTGWSRPCTHCIHHTRLIKAIRQIHVFMTQHFSTTRHSMQEHIGHSHCYCYWPATGIYSWQRSHQSAWNYAWQYISVPDRSYALLGAVPLEDPQIQNFRLFDPK